MIRVRRYLKKVTQLPGVHQKKVYPGKIYIILLTHTEFSQIFDGNLLAYCLGNNSYRFLKGGLKCEPANDKSTYSRTQIRKQLDYCFPRWCTDLNRMDWFLLSWFFSIFSILTLFYLTILKLGKNLKYIFFYVWPESHLLGNDNVAEDVRCFFLI